MVISTEPAQGHENTDRVPYGDAVAPRTRARARASPARQEYTARSGLWVSPSVPLAVGNQASPRPEPASSAGRNLVRRSGQTGKAAALWWARTSSLRVRLDCSSRAKHEGQLGHRPHRWYTRVVYSERCTARAVMYRQLYSDSYGQATPLCLTQGWDEGCGWCNEVRGRGREREGLGRQSRNKEALSRAHMQSAGERRQARPERRKGEGSGADAGHGHTRREGHGRRLVADRNNRSSSDRRHANDPH